MNQESRPRLLLDPVFSGENWGRVGMFALAIFIPILIAAALAVIWLDGPAAVFFKASYGNPLHLWARRWTDIGKAEPYFAVMGGLWILLLAVRRFGRIGSWKHVEQWALYGLFSFLASGILVQIFKHIFGRKRPYAVSSLSSAHEFSPFTTNYEFHSMPSGHSQVLFTAAAVLIARWPRLWYLWIGLAATFASTRVITLNHWLSDIIVGAGIGILGTILFYRGVQMFKTKRLQKQSAQKAVAALAFIIFGFLPGLSRADAPGPFGFGLVLGDPTGVSANYYLSSQRSIDAALAWSFGADPGFQIHGDYLWHREGIIRDPKVSFDLHYGVGGRLMSLRDEKVKDRTRFGVRLPVGLSTNFNQRALEVFGELALAMNLVPSTSADLDFGVGARVYF